MTTLRVLLLSAALARLLTGCSTPVRCLAPAMPCCDLDGGQIVGYWSPCGGASCRSGSINCTDLDAGGDGGDAGDAIDSGEVPPDVPPDVPMDGSMCPATAPTSGQACSGSLSCSYGTETCCGMTYPSLLCTCNGTSFSCAATDACLIPPDSCEGGPIDAGPADVGGDGASCQPNGATCTRNADCCSNNCILRTTPGYCCVPGGCP